MTDGSDVRSEVTGDAILRRERDRILRENALAVVAFVSEVLRYAREHTYTDDEARRFVRAVAAELKASDITAPPSMRADYERQLEWQRQAEDAGSNDV